GSQTSSTRSGRPLRLGVGLDVGEQDPVVGWFRLGPLACLGGDRPAATGRKPLPHARWWADFGGFADLWARAAGLGALGLALALRFLLRPLQVRLAPSLEAVVAAPGHRSPMRTSY